MGTKLHERTALAPLPPEANTELHHHLSSLAVLHAVPEVQKQRKSLPPNTHLLSDLAGSEYMERGLHTVQHHHANPAQRFRMPWQRNPMDIPRDVDPHVAHEKDQMLRSVHEVIRSEARLAPGEQKVNWLMTSQELLRRAKIEEDVEKRDALLVGAAAAAQFSPDETERMSFLESVYDGALQEDMAGACSRSHLVLLTTKLPKKRQKRDIEVHSLKSFTPAFQLEPEEFSKYVTYVRTTSAEGVSGGEHTAKTLQKLLTTHSQAGVRPENIQNQAMDASVRGEKVKGPMLDIYKIERFALEWHFIKEQIKTVLGPDLSDTPLAKKLEQKRTSISNIIDQYSVLPGSNRPPEADIDLQMKKLEQDTKAAFRELGTPVAFRFMLSKDDLAAEKSTLTPEKQAALRFRDISSKIKGHVAVSRFLDTEAFVRSRDRKDILTQHAEGIAHEIWEVPLDGADTPRSCIDILSKLLKATVRDQKKLGPIAPEELRDFAQSHRIDLIALATFHGADFFDVNTGETAPLAERDGTGKLQLSRTYKLIPKESLDMYSAITLGCPALREIHEDRPSRNEPERRIAQGSSNYIDHALAVIINEAYKRGALNLENYIR